MLLLMELALMMRPFRCLHSAYVHPFRKYIFILFGIQTHQLEKWKSKYDQEFESSSSTCSVLKRKILQKNAARIFDKKIEGRQYGNIRTEAHHLMPLKMQIYHFSYIRHIEMKRAQIKKCKMQKRWKEQEKIRNRWGYTSVNR